MRIRDAFGPGKNGSPDRLHMIRLEDAHHTRLVLLFTLTVPLHAARSLYVLDCEEARRGGGS